MIFKELLKKIVDTQGKIQTPVLPPAAKAKTVQEAAKAVSQEIQAGKGKPGR